MNKKRLMELAGLVNEEWNRRDVLAVARACKEDSKYKGFAKEIEEIKNGVQINIPLTIRIAKYSTDTVVVLGGNKSDYEYTDVDDIDVGDMLSIAGSHYQTYQKMQKRIRKFNNDTDAWIRSVAAKHLGLSASSGRTMNSTDITDVWNELFA